jgi:hypothetical protein
MAIQIQFPQRDPARAVLAAPRRPVASLLEELGLAGPQAVVPFIRGAETLDPTIEPRLGRLFELGVIPAADLAKAIIVDGGTQSGVMAALGRAAGESDATVQLVGVASAGKVTWPGDDRDLAETTQLEPNHSHVRRGTR